MKQNQANDKNDGLSGTNGTRRGMLLFRCSKKTVFPSGKEKRPPVGTRKTKSSGRISPVHAPGPDIFRTRAVLRQGAAEKQNA